MKNRYNYKRRSRRIRDVFAESSVLKCHSNKSTSKNLKKLANHILPSLTRVSSPLYLIFYPVKSKWKRHILYKAEIESRIRKRSRINLKNRLHIVSRGFSEFYKTFFTKKLKSRHWNLLHHQFSRNVGFKFLKFRVGRVRLFLGPRRDHYATWRFIVSAETLHVLITQIFRNCSLTAAYFTS